MVKDYFSFDTIRDSEGKVICYYVTVIGTIEADGVSRVRTDLRNDGSGKMAFGQVTVRGRDRKVSTMLSETGARVRSHSTDIDGTSVDVISYTASDWRADEAFEFTEGDRVLVQGKAYLRKNERRPEGRPELSITATGLFLLGHKKEQRHTSMSKRMGIVPQKD